MGKRGEGWVIGQFLIGALILLAPPSAPMRGRPWLVALGLLIGMLGAAVVGVAFVTLGRNLTAYPKPLDDGELVERGLYGVVRHPIYSGVLVGALGWSLFRQSPLAVMMTLVLALWLNAKATREEHWLAEKYPGYRSYQQRVRRLIPWLY